MLRLLIADDEDLVRHGLVALIEREAPNISIVGTAVDGEDALDIAARVDPDAVLTDIRMPGMNGLELIHRLRARLPKLRCIILSGYDEFEYARRAVSLGVAEYLLKPVDPDELLAILEHVHAGVEAERRERDLRNTTRYLTIEQSARRLLDGFEVDPDVLASCFPAAPAWGLVLIQRPAGAVLDGQPLRELCRTTLENAVVVDDAYGYLCVLFPSESGDIDEAAASARRLHHAMRTAGLPAAVTVARPSSTLVGLGDAHGEALETAEYHAIGDLDEPLLSWELLSRPAERWPLLSPVLKDALLDAVAQGLDGDAQQEARAFMEHARAHIAPGALRALWFEIVVLLVNRAQQYGVRADALLEPRQDLRALLAGPADAVVLEAQLVSLASRAARECRRLREHHSPRAAIPELREFVATHLDGDLTIAALARHMHLNAKYLGELFKQSTGESLGEFVIRARMKRACDLLTSSTLKIYAVAEQIGYADPKHFASMFRSVIGMSPAEYREQWRRQPEESAVES